MAKSGGRHQPAVKMVAAIFCVGGAARLSRPSSAEVVGDGGRESQVEQMIIVAKEAGQWCWVIVAHFERSVSVCQSSYHN